MRTERHGGQRVQSLGQGSRFIRQSIPALMRDYLRGVGIVVPALIDTLENIEEFVQFCLPYSTMGLVQLRRVILGARASAFDHKYSDYTYDEDLRGLDVSWKTHIHDFITGYGSISNFNQQNIIVVGIGNGIEGIGLLDTLENLTIVNVAPRALCEAKTALPNAQAYLNGAEELADIASRSQDVYISLRTFQSAFFDLERAILEAGRVLRESGRLVVSISNGYIGSQGQIVRGHITAGLRLDPFQPERVCDRIERFLSIHGFHDIDRSAGFSEIFIHGTAD